MNRSLNYTDPTGTYPIWIPFSPPAAGMTVDDFGGRLEEETTVTTPPWRGTNNNPNTGLWGATSLSFGRGFMDSLSTGFGALDVYRAQDFYQGNFDRYAVEGNTALAFLNFAVDELFVPDSQAELGVELAMVFIPGGKIGKIAGKAGKGLFKSADALRRHNKVVRDVVTHLKLTRKQQRILHDAITKQDMGYHEILQLARDLFSK
jgi:hypothetical protein